MWDQGKLIPPWQYRVRRASRKAHPIQQDRIQAPRSSENRTISQRKEHRPTFRSRAYVIVGLNASTNGKLFIFSPHHKLAQLSYASGR
jgi:hypothetical protein